MGFKIRFTTDPMGTNDAKEHTTNSNTDAEINTKRAHISTEPAANDVASKLHTPEHHRTCCFFLRNEHAAS
jgi:hypothetical protein